VASRQANFFSLSLRIFSRYPPPGVRGTFTLSYDRTPPGFLVIYCAHTYAAYECTNRRQVCESVHRRYDGEFNYFDHYNYSAIIINITRTRTVVMMKSIIINVCRRGTKMRVRSAHEVGTGVLLLYAETRARATSRLRNVHVYASCK
jgi:hypothetical protein